MSQVEFGQPSDPAAVGAISDRSQRLARQYADHAPEAMGLAYLLTGDRELSQDLAQEAFVRIAGRWGNLRDTESFRFYLRRTIINLVSSHWRRKRLERTFAARERTFRQTGTNSMPDFESMDELRGALLRLPHRQRAAIVLRHYYDLSEHQTADLLLCSAGAVRSLVLRGMQMLRTELGRDDSD